MSHAQTLRGPASRRWGGLTIRNNVNGWLFISPWLIGFVVLTLYPSLSSLYHSFTVYNVLQPPQWAGLDNYRQILTEDPLFLTAVSNTLFFVGLYVPLTILIGVGIAMLLNLPVRGQAFYRTFVFLPSVVPEIVVALLWSWLLNPQFGVSNIVLHALRLPGIGWLTDPSWSKPALVLIGMWGVGNSVVIYLAALQDVPQHLYEAATIDGAGIWEKARHITLPMITPTIFFNLVLGIIYGVQTFTNAFVISKGTGGPVDSTTFYGLLIYRNAFTYLKMGYASAMAWLLFLAILLLTLVIFRTSGRWVFYIGESR